MHIPVEQVLEEFAERVPSEDVKSFVTVFVTAKKSGGDMIGISVIQPVRSAIR